MGISFRLVFTWYFINRIACVISLRSFCQNDRNEITPAMSFKRTCALNAVTNESALIHFDSGKFCSYEISCRFEISWQIWNPYRFDFHFASIHVNTSKKLIKTEMISWSKWNLIPVWVHFSSHVNLLLFSVVFHVLRTWIAQGGSYESFSYH